MMENSKKKIKEKVKNSVKIILFGLIVGLVGIMLFMEFIKENNIIHLLVAILMILVSIFCLYAVFYDVYYELVNKDKLRRRRLINIIYEDNYPYHAKYDYDTLLLLKKEIERHKYKEDKRFMPQLKIDYEWRQIFLKEESKRHIKAGDISFAYKNLFELISAENPALYGASLHGMDFSKDRKKLETYYKDGFVCEQEKNIIIEMINDIEKATNDKNEKADIIQKNVSDMLTDEIYNKLKELYVEECDVLDIIFFEKENINSGQYGFRYNDLKDEIINEWAGNEYVIIGYDSSVGFGPEPYIMKIDEKELPIFWLMTDGGDWKNPDKIANSFDDFIKIINCLNKNLTSNKNINKELILNEIRTINSNKNMGYWEILLNRFIDNK